MALTWQGKTQSLAAWAAELGLSKSGLRKRLALGWGMARIAATRPQQTRWLTCQGRTQTIAAWATELGITKHCLEARLARLPAEQALALPKRAAHGMGRSREWRTWSNMKTRCYNVQASHYKDYGGRGIRVCRRWLASFENFYQDMGPCPPGHTLDRKRVNGHYTPGNCRWATQKEQTRNARSNIRLTFHGLTLCVTAWAERLGISSRTIRSRLKLGWPVERTLTTPPVLGRNQYA